MDENLKELENNIRSQAEVKLNQPQNELRLNITPTDTRQSFYGYSGDTFDMKYATMNDGDIISRYDSYLPGADNAELAAQTQSTWDKWSHGMLKAGANLLTTIAGNTVGFVVGATEGISQGSWNAVFDNKFSNTLADWNEKLDYQLPNYVSKDEQDENFFQSLNNANFWAKDVMGGASFTLGTIVSEAIWAFATGGLVNSAKWGATGARLANRWGKVAIGAEEAAVGVANSKNFIASGINKLYKIDNFTSIATGAKIGANTAKTLNTARFLATTSGNEAGIEALHYKREQTENFYRDFEKLNGRNPTENEISEFNDNLEQSANAVFATNMAILMPSNLAMFGSLFNIASPTKGLAKAMNKSLFGIGVEKTAGEAGEVAYRGLQATGRQKVAQYTYAALKPILTEGIWEEGLQGVTTKTAENWIETTYNPKYNNQTVSLADATYKAFAEQYGSKEGWKEIGIGGIIGGGSSIIIGRGKFQEVREFERAEKYQEDYVASGLNQFGDQSALATDSIARKMMFDARVANGVERQKEAMDRGDDVGASLASQDVSIAEIQWRKSMGEDLNNLIDRYETAIQTVPNDDSTFKERGIEDPQAYKTAVIEAYKGLVKSYEKASDFADAVLGESKILGQDISTQQLKDALTYSIVSGQKANVMMDGLLQDIGQIIGTESQKSLEIQTILQEQGEAKQQQVARVNNKISQAELEVKTLSKELQRLQVSKDETKGARLQKVQEKLTEANERVVDLKAERETLAQEVSQESKRRRNIQGTDLTNINLVGEFITGNDLANIDGKLQNIEDSIKAYEGVNHEIYYDLLDLKRQYNTAKENYFSFQSSVDAIINGKFQPKFSKASGLLGKVMNSKEPIDNFTGEYLTQIWNNYLNSGARATGKDVLEEFISDEEYNTFRETGVISDEILSKLSEAVSKKEILTERENEVLRAKSSEINALLRPNPNKPNLSPESLIERELSQLQAEKKRLENLPKESTTRDIQNLTQDEFAQFLQDNYADDLTQDQIYKLLTVRSELRQAMLDESSEEWAKRFEKNADYKQQHNNIDNNKELRGTSNPAWTGISVGDPTNQATEGRHKGYVTVSAKSARKLAENVEQTFKDLYAELKASGYNGHLKMPSTFSDLLTRFDNIVIHGATEADVDLAIPIIEKYLSENNIEVESTKKGLDEKGANGKETSHTNLLAEKTKNKELEVGEQKESNQILEVEKQIAEINKKIEAINRNQGTLTEAEQLRKTIEDSFKKDYPMLTQDVDEMIKGKPSEEEVKRYQQLYKKQADFTTKEKKEFDDLQPRMQRWFMAQSLPVGGATIADLVEILSQLETQTAKDETLTEISSDTLAQETAEQKSASEVTRQDILQNISGNAVTKIIDKEIYLSHINPKTVFDRLSNPAISTFLIRTVNDKGKLNKSQDLTPALVATESKKAGTEFTIGDTKIIIGVRGEIIMSLDDYNKVKDILNLYYFKPDTGSVSYMDLYERLDDGTTRKKSSEFETNTESNLLYNAEIGDSLNMFVDMKTNYNQNLINDVIKERKKGDLTVELKNKIQNKLEITSRKNNDNNSTLKALYDKDGVENDNFIYLRKKYADKFIEAIRSLPEKITIEQALATLPNKIDLEAEVNVKDMYLGTPNYQLDENLRPRELSITEAGAGKAVTQGFVKGSEMTLGDKTVNVDNISRLYVTNLAKANPELKIPVVILQKGKYQFAFPIAMIKTQDNKEALLDDILNTLDTPIEAVKATNILMMSLGSNTRIVRGTQEEFEKVRAELQNYQTFKTADEIADVNYKSEQLIQDATIKVDLENEVISSPKVTVDYSTLTIGKLEDTENDAIELRKEIVDDIIKIRNIINSSEGIPEQNRFVQAFDENDVENKKDVDIMNRKDINFIKKVFFNDNGGLISVQGVAVETIGKERLLKLRDKLQTLQFYVNQIKVHKDKKTENNITCNS